MVTGADVAPGAGVAVTDMARRLGVAPATLRTWDRRYGLGPGAHLAGTARRYSAADVRRLERMRRLTLAGVGPAEAAARALVEVGPAGEEGPVAGGSGERDRPVSGAAARGLARAALALDAATTTALVSAALRDLGVHRAWDQVLRPVLVAAGQRWASTGEGVDVEHLLSQCVADALRAPGLLPAPGLQAPTPPPPALSPPALPPAVLPAPALPGRRPVLLACCEGEQHSLPLFVLAAALVERQLVASVLGPATPAAALHAAVRRTGPAAVFVWSQQASSADRAGLAAVPSTRPAVVVIAGGPGWDPGGLPPRVASATSLSQAVDLVQGAHGGPAGR